MCLMPFRYNIIQMLVRFKTSSPKQWFALFLSTVVLWFYLGYTYFPSNGVISCPPQDNGELPNQSTNTTIIYTTTLDGKISSGVPPPIEVPSIGPNPAEQVRRLLWWSSIYGGDVAYFAIGDGDELISLATKCKVKCEFTTNKTLLESSHGVIFHGWGEDLPTENVVIGDTNVTVPKGAPPVRFPNQMYIYMTLEAPPRIRTNMEAYKEFFNWTMTYNLNSDFPITYGRFVRKSPEDILSYQPADDINYIQLANRTKIAAWMVSNCDDAPSQRNKLVEELQKHIPISTYGKCGTNQCNETIDPDCWTELAMSHKFYLSFENSLCEDYVTEKFFNPLRAKMVPIVYGKANYGHQFAPGSFINVDSFASVKALAHYLLYLNENDEEYLKYFEWRKYYRLDQGWPLEETYCGACERLHKENPPAPSMLDINDWLFRKNSEGSVCDEVPANF